MMRVVWIYLGLLIVALVARTRAEITMNYCSISCSDNSAISNHRDESVNLLAGPPGKRGVPGLPGPRGVKGSKGIQGKSCDCTNVDKELETMKISFNNLKRFSLSGWVKARNDRWYRLVREKATFTRARELCRSIGGNLASTGMRNDTIRREVVSLLKFKSSEFIWIGLSDTASEGTWVWDDGSTEAVTNWADRQPDNGSGNENCAHFYRKFNFNDDQCYNIHYYLCETEEI